MQSITHIALDAIQKIENIAAESAREQEPVQQRESIAGPRRHIRICRSLINNNSPDAWQVGRLYFVRRGALERALAGHVRRNSERTEAKNHAEKELLDELGLEQKA